jgi:hypothetical protein
MNLWEAMGAVRAGNNVRFHVVTPGGVVALESKDLKNTEFELIEEPVVREYMFCPRHQFAQSAYPCLCDSADKKAIADARAEVKFLEGQVESYGATIARLERELAEAKSMIREARSALDTEPVSR